MRRLLQRLLLLPTLAVFLVVTTHALHAAPDEPGLDALRAGVIDSFVKGDIDRLLTFLDPDVVVTWQNGEVSRGPAEVRAYYDRMMKGERPIVQKVTADPRVLGRRLGPDWAVSWGNLNDHFVLTDGSELALNSVFTITTAKRDGRWLLTGYHASVNAFDNPVLKLATRRVATWSVIGGAVAGVLLGFLVGRRAGARAAAP